MSVKSLLYLSLLLLSQNTNAQEANEAVQFIDHPDKNEYLLHQPGSDKHKYGYELRDNKHFHHTTTEDDGVRLGCYGYVLEGKKYSTQYVADIKGYRPVFTYDVINVYPKSGDVREASFIGNFNEDERKSSNIRYFFPEGCRADEELTPENNPMPSPVPLKQPPPPPSPPVTVTQAKPTPPPATRQTSEKPKPSPIPSPPPTKKIPQPSPPVVTPPPSVPSTYLPPIASTYLPPVKSSIPGKYITKAYNNNNNKPSVTTPKVQVTTPKAQVTTQKVQVTTPKVTTKSSFIPQTSPPASSKPVISNLCEINGNCESQTITIKNPTDTCNQCCSENESSPSVTIPIKLSSNSKSGSCSSYAKLIIPADSVSQEKLKSLLNNPTELTKDILRSLS